MEMIPHETPGECAQAVEMQLLAQQLAKLPFFRVAQEQIPPHDSGYHMIEVCLTIVTQLKRRRA